MWLIYFSHGWCPHQPLYLQSNDFSILLSNMCWVKTPNTGKVFRKKIEKDSIDFYLLASSYSFISVAQISFKGRIVWMYSIAGPAHHTVL